jgi:hypothetical protein
VPNNWPGRYARTSTQSEAGASEKTVAGEEEKNFNTNPACCYPGAGVKAWYLPNLIMTWSTSRRKKVDKKGGSDINKR